MNERGVLFDVTDCEVLESVMARRRDVRGNRFTSDAVSDDSINRIIDAGLCAPSVGFSQPWEFVVVRDVNIRAQVRDSHLCENARASKQFDEEKSRLYRQLKLDGIVEAPVNVAVFYRPSDEPVLGQSTMREVGLYSVVCAVQNMWLMARALNLGMGWVSILDPEQVKSILHAAAPLQLIAYLCVGHVDRFEEQPELERLGWEKRKMREQVVHHERFANR
ncbi:MAG: 5,6-dimethylbenzimidazole synthase [Gammaproteobacteria bacterium]|jgi:5,6-dimethylbenzimidazole synthase